MSISDGRLRGTKRGNEDTGPSPTKPVMSKFDSLKIGDQDKKMAKAKQDKQLETFTIKFAPKKRSELLTPTVSLNKLERWLRDERIDQQTGQGKVLVLSGPSGCGKTSALRFIAHELGLVLFEFTPSEASYSGSHDVDSKKDFDDLIVRGLHLFLKTSSYQQEAKRAVCVIKYLPELFFRKPVLFQNAIKAHLNFIRQQDLQSLIKLPARLPLVFLFTNGSASSMTHYGAGLTMETFGGSLCLDRLLPYPMRREHGIDEIKLHPLKASLRKRLLTLPGLNYGHLTEIHVDRVFQMSAGDVRHALLSLEFLLESAEVIKPFNSSKSAKRNRIDTCEAIESVLNLMGRDQSVNFFHNIGKILYAKREESNQNLNMSSHFDSPLTPHYRIHDLPLKDDPSRVIMEMERQVGNQSDYSNTSIMDFIFEHYQNNTTALHAVEEISHYISLADSITLDITSKAMGQRYKALIASLAHTYYGELQESSISGNNFQSLNKPKYSYLQDAVFNFEKEILTSDIHRYEESPLLMSSYETGLMRRTTRELIMDYSFYTAHLPGGHSVHLPKHLRAYSEWTNTYHREYHSSHSNPTSFFKSPNPKQQYYNKVNTRTSRNKDGDNDDEMVYPVNRELSEEDKRDFIIHS